MLIRRPRPQELEHIAGLEADVFAHPWTPEGFAQAFADDHVIFLVAEDERAAQGRILGYALLYAAADEGEIPTIAVDRGCRRRGVAAALLDSLLAEARKRGVEHVYLEVRRSNAAAKALYAACGFSKVGVRPGFYRDPVEDADLMMCNLWEELC